MVFSFDFHDVFCLCRPENLNFGEEIGSLRNNAFFVKNHQYDYHCQRSEAISG
jgi:hypothetical protein